MSTEWLPEDFWDSPEELHLKEQAKDPDLTDYEGPGPLSQALKTKEGREKLAQAMTASLRIGGQYKPPSHSIKPLNEVEEEDVWGWNED